MYLFDNFSSSLGSISSALVLPVSRGRHGKLVDTFSHESDLTSLQFPILFLLPVKSEDAFFLKQCVLASSFPDLVDVLPSVLATRISSSFSYVSHHGGTGTTRDQF